MKYYLVTNDRTIEEYSKNNKIHKGIYGLFLYYW